MIGVDHLTLPNASLSNFQLLEAVRELKIPHFRGVYMRDSLPFKPKSLECGILNLDDASGRGTHWTVWYKNYDSKIYFDSFGLCPPLELQNYLNSPIYYNTEQVQPRDQVFCGHLCLYVLKRLSEGKSLQEIINVMF